MKSASAFDVNGDGRSDLIMKVTTTTTSGGCYVRGRLIPHVDERECRNDIGGTWSGGTSTSTNYKLYKSSGSPSAPTLSYAQTLGSASSLNTLRVADLNGDGLSDLVYVQADKWYYRLSDGTQLLPARDAGLVTSSTKKYLNQFVDLNGDGRTDVLHATSTSNWYVYFSRPTTDAEWIKFEGRGTKSFDANAAVRFGDTNGDGKLDLLTATSGTWKEHTSRKNIKEYVINRITNGNGIETNVTYKPMTDTSVYVIQASDSNSNSNTFSPVSGMQVVSRVATDSNVGSSVAVSYQYGGMLVHKKGRGSLGFQMLRTTDEQTGVVTETHYNQDYNDANFAKARMPKYTEQRLNGVLISSATNTLAVRATANNGVFPYIAESVEKSWSIGSNGDQYEIAKTVSDFTYDPYGNLTDSTVTISEHSDSDALVTTTENIYGSSEWEQEKGRLSETTVTKTRGSDTQSRTSHFTYYGRYETDNLGMLKTTTLFEGSVKQLVTTYLYDQYGNKTQVSKAGAENADGSNLQTRTSSSLYSADGRYLAQTTNAAGVITEYQYNGVSAESVSGIISSITINTNNVSSTKYFDEMGQTYRVSADGVADVYTDIEFCFDVSCDNNNAHYQVRQVQAGSPEKIAYFDPWGRKIESRVKNFSGGWTKIFRTYDSQGREERIYEPTNGSYGIYYTQPTYDDFGRIIQVRHPNGAISKTEFYGLQTDSIDPKNNRSSSWKNSQGELAETEDVIGNRLEYFYDAYGNLLQVDAINSVNVSTTRISNSFDAYGHKVETNDQDKGLWEYQYNAFGELVWQKTARGHITKLDYDTAGRLIRRNENEGTSCWNYHATTGRLENEKLFKDVDKALTQCNETTANYQKTYFYDSYGRVDEVDTSISGINSNVDGNYIESKSFDSYGRVSSVTYPNNLSVTQTYRNGYLDQLKNTANGRVYQNINGMNAYGQVTNVVYANGAQELISYQAEDGKVASHQLSVSGTQKHYLSYAYDLNNNLDWRRHDYTAKGFTDWEETLAYDALNRLDYRNVTIHDSSYLSAGFKSDQDYNYDDWGNLTSKYGVGNYSYDTTRKNRLISTSGSRNFSMSYDPNGNITSDGDGRSFSYFGFDKVNRISGSSQYSEFLYGTNRARYYKHDRRIEDGQTTDYYTAYVGAYEKIYRTGGGKSALTEQKVTLGNVVITERSDGEDDEHYLHKDHLGSAISITDKTGSVVQQLAYDPWGKQSKIYQTSDFLNLVYNQPTNRGYTGHEHIRDLDIVHMNGRIYDADIGRFMQADPNIQSMDNFQNYNRYSYVLNNPLSMTDPSGFFFKKLFKAVKKYWRTIASIVISVYLPGSSGLLSGWGVTNVVAQGAITGFIAGGVATGSLRGAIAGAISGAMFGSLHDVKDYAVLKHGLAGGLSSVINGGKFGHGFFSAGFTKSLGDSGFFKDKPILSSDRFKNAMKAALVGGTMSRLTGGKFANGAVTGAFSRLLNDDAAAEKKREITKSEEGIYLAAEDSKSGFQISQEGAAEIFKKLRLSDVPEPLVIDEAGILLADDMLAAAVPAQDLISLLEPSPFAKFKTLITGTKIVTNGLKTEAKSYWRSKISDIKFGMGARAGVKYSHDMMTRYWELSR